MIFEGHVLAYNPSTNKAEWIPVCGTTSDLSCTDVVSTLTLCNLVLCIPDEAASRLDQFGEHRDVEGVGEASLTEVTQKEGLGEELMCEDEPEDADDEDVDDKDTDNTITSSSASSQESQHSTHCYYDRHCHPHSLAECCESEDREDDSLVKLPTGQFSRGEGESEVKHPPAPTSSPLGVQESSSEPMGAAPEETASAASEVPPTSSKDAVVHVTEDELKSLDKRRPCIEKEEHRLKKKAVEQVPKLKFKTFSLEKVNFNVQTVVNIFHANKVVVGYGCGDVPKYMEEAVASHCPLGESGGSSRSICMQFCVVFYILSLKMHCDMPQTHRIQHVS